MPQELGLNPAWSLSVVMETACIGKAGGQAGVAAPQMAWGPGSPDCSLPTVSLCTFLALPTLSTKLPRQPPHTPRFTTSDYKW